MTPSRLEDLEVLRGMLAAIASDLTTINAEDKDVHRELAIARIHASEAVKALNLFLKDKLAEPVDTWNALTEDAGLNSGTDS